jgi:hypothetical protein
MRFTLSIPDSVARSFQASVPSRLRSQLVTRLIEKELVRRNDDLARACQSANRDAKLEKETLEWNAFDDFVEEE